MEKFKHIESPKGQCVIHQTVSNEDDDSVLSPQNYDSWLTLLEAAKVQNHSSILDIAKQLQDKEIPQIFYHRKCRSLFTMRKSLDTLKRKADESISEAGGSGDASKRPTRIPTSETRVRVYDSICIFCDKVNKYRKNSNSREKLTQCCELRADQTLRECAIKKEDGKVLAIMSRDIVAAGAHYHVSCYKKYTRVNKEQQVYRKQNIEDIEEDRDELYQRIERDAYADLFKYIRTDIIPNKKIIEVSSLTEQLEFSILSSTKVKLLKDSTRKHIHRKLELELGESVNIYPDDKGKLLMVPNSVSLKDVVIENQNLHRELKMWKASLNNFNKIIDQASSQIRSAIKQEKTPTPWPYHPSDSAHYSIPHQLERFLVGLLTGDPDTEFPSHRVTTLVQSFSQDVIYAVTCGQHKPPKHVLLPYAVKTLTGNTEIIRTLNKFGHGVSYCQLEENDTALCLQKLATGPTERVAL